MNGRRGKTDLCTYEEPKRTPLRRGRGNHIDRIGYRCHTKVWDPPGHVLNREDKGKHSCIYIPWDLVEDKALAGMRNMLSGDHLA